MKTMLTTFYAKPLALYLAAALLAISTFAGTAEAMFVTAVPRQNAVAAESTDRAADLIRIQSALESKIVQQKLLDYGLSPEETMARVNALSSEQINQLASHSDALQAGGDPVDLVVSLLVIALLVVLLIYVIQGRVVIR